MDGAQATDVESFQAALKEYQPTADRLPVELRRSGKDNGASFLLPEQKVMCT